MNIIPNSYVLFDLSDANVMVFPGNSKNGSTNLVKTCNNIFVISEKIRVNFGYNKLGISDNFLVPVITIVDKHSFRLINYFILKNKIRHEASLFTCSSFTQNDLDYINNSNLFEEIKYNIFIKRYNILNKHKFDNIFNFMRIFTDCIDNDL